MSDYREHACSRCGSLLHYECDPTHEVQRAFRTALAAANAELVKVRVDFANACDVGRRAEARADELAKKLAEAERELARVKEPVTQYVDRTRLDLEVSKKRTTDAEQRIKEAVDVLCRAKSAPKSAAAAALRILTRLAEAPR